MQLFDIAFFFLFDVCYSHILLFSLSPHPVCFPSHYIIVYIFAYFLTSNHTKRLPYIFSYNMLDSISILIFVLLFLLKICMVIGYFTFLFVFFFPSFCLFSAQTWHLHEHNTQIMYGHICTFSVYRHLPLPVGQKKSWKLRQALHQGSNEKHTDGQSHHKELGHPGIQRIFLYKPIFSTLRGSHPAIAVMIREDVNRYLSPTQWSVGNKWMTWMWSLCNLFFTDSLCHYSFNRIS